MEEEAPKYKIIFLDSQKESQNSRGFTGRGRASYINGDTYEGDYMEGLRSGSGTYTYKNGYVYRGEFSENLRNGQGEFTYRKKGSYQGQFVNSQRCGQGTFRYPNGDRYEGQWTAGRKDGFGIYFFPRVGQRLEGTWRNGRFLEGKWVLENQGLVYEGAFKHGKPVGPGVWTNAEGNLTHGHYRHELPPEDEEPTEQPTEDVNFEALEKEAEIARQRALAEENGTGEADQPPAEDGKDEEEEEEEPEPEEEPADAEKLQDGAIADELKRGTEAEEKEDPRMRFRWNFRLGLFDAASQVKETSF